MPQREDRKACFGLIYTDGIRSFPHDERGKRRTKSFHYSSRARIFNETFRDKGIVRCLIIIKSRRLRRTIPQCVGVNYNQTVVAMKSNFTGEESLAMPAKRNWHWISNNLEVKSCNWTRIFKRNGNFDSSHFTSVLFFMDVRKIRLPSSFWEAWLIVIWM